MSPLLVEWWHPSQVWPCPSMQAVHFERSQAPRPLTGRFDASLLEDSKSQDPGGTPAAETPGRPDASLVMAAQLAALGASNLCPAAEAKVDFHWHVQFWRIGKELCSGGLTLPTVKGRLPQFALNSHPKTCIERSALCSPCSVWDLGGPLPEEPVHPREAPVFAQQCGLDVLVSRQVSQIAQGGHRRLPAQHFGSNSFDVFRPHIT